MYTSILNLFLSSTYLYKVFPKNRFFGRERLTWWKYDETREVDAISGCYMFVRRRAIDIVGILDEDYFMYFEEVDWCYRLKKEGWKIVFHPGGSIIHYGGMSAGHSPVAMRLQFAGSQLLFFRKHRSKGEYFMASVLLGVFFIIRLPYWLFIAIFCKEKRRESLRNISIYIKGAVGCWTGGKSLLIHN